MKPATHPKAKQAVCIAKFQTACEVFINLTPIACAMCAMHAYDYAAFGRRAYLRRYGAEAAFLFRVKMVPCMPE